MNETQWYIVRMEDFSEEEANEFLNELLHDAKWKRDQTMALSHLTDKGVKRLKEHVLKEESDEE